MSEKVYLSGKITGLSGWYISAKFWLSEKYLRVMGFDVWNPVKEVPKTATWGEAMNICLKALRECEFVYFQRDWKRSRGARIEFKQAARDGKMLINTRVNTRREYYQTIEEYLM